MDTPIQINYFENIFFDTSDYIDVYLTIKDNTTTIKIKND